VFRKPLPSPIDRAGRGAWHGWLYEVEAINETGHNESLGSTEALQLTHADLLPDTSYKFRVRATSAGGIGPWSEFFESVTLSDGNKRVRMSQLLIFLVYLIDSVMPVLVYSDNSSAGSPLYERSLNGSRRVEATELTNSSTFQGSVQDFEKCGNQTVWSNRDGRVYVSAGGRPASMLTYVHDAAAIAFDWLGNRLYWSNKFNMVCLRPLHHLAVTFFCRFSASL
jgi:hypothetical protein